MPPRATFVNERPRWQVIGIGVALLALVAYVDWVARPELSLGPFHLIPVAMVAWWAGRVAGLVMAAVTAVVWSAAMLKGNSREHEVMLLGQRLDGEIRTVDGLIQQARTLIFDLYPAMLDDLGLAPTLEWYGEEFHRRTGIEVSVSQQGASSALPTAMAHYLFRAIKELMGNA